MVTHDEKISPTFKPIYHIRDGKTYEEPGFTAWAILAHARAWSPDVVSRLSVGFIIAALALSATNAFVERKPMVAASFTFLWVVFLGAAHVLAWRFSPGRATYCSELGVRCSDWIYAFALPALGVIAAVVAAAISAGISAVLARLARRRSRADNAHPEP